MTSSADFQAAVPGLWSQRRGPDGDCEVCSEGLPPLKYSARLESC